MSLAVRTFENMIISPALGVIANSFPQVSIDLVQELLTIPSLLMILMSLISGHIERKIGVRKLLITGMILELLGVLGYFGDTLGFDFLLITRVFFGIGNGLIMPTAVSIIQKLFTGREREKMLGYNGATSSVVGVIFSMLGGYLATISWKFCFLVYLIQIPLLFVIRFLLPEPQIQAEQKVRLQEAVKPMTLIMSLGNLIQSILASAFTLNIAIVLGYEKIGNATFAGTILSINMAAAFVGGLLYGSFIARIFKRYTIVLALTLQCLGLFMLLITNSALPFCIASILFGLGFALYNAEAGLRVMSTVKKEHSSVAVGIFIAAMGLGQFISPIVLTPIAKQLFNNATPLGPWLVACTGLAIGVLFMVVIITLTKPRKQ